MHFIFTFKFPRKLNFTSTLHMKPAYSFQNFLLNSNIHIGNEMIDSVTLWWIYNTGSFTLSLFGQCVSVTQWIYDTGNFFQSLFGKFVTPIVFIEVTLWWICDTGIITQSLFGECPVFAKASLYCWWYLKNGGSIYQRVHSFCLNMARWQ